MAKASTKAATLTTLAIGKIEVGVGLFTAHADPKKKLVEFDTAGPNGGVLKARSVARPVPVEEAVERPDEPVVRSDPFGDDLFDGAPPPEGDPRGMSGEHNGPMLNPDRCGPDQVPLDALVDGEYGRELVEEGTGEIVSPDQVRRGVRLEDGTFIDCTEHLKRIEEKTRLEKMEVLGFVDISGISRARGVKSYWLGAADERAPVALRALFEALRATRRSALVKVTKKTRQSLGVIGWYGKALVFYELVWAEDFREPPARATVIQQAQVTDTMVENMTKLVRAMSVPPSVVDDLRDDAIGLREELHARALRGEIEAIEADAEALAEGNALMDQLEQSLVAVG